MFFDPTGTLEPSQLQLSGIAFRYVESVGFQELLILGLDRTACELAVYASRPRLPLGSRKTHFKVAG